MNSIIEQRINKLQREIDLAEYNLKSNFNEFEIQDMLPEINLFSSNPYNTRSHGASPKESLLGKVAKLLLDKNDLSSLVTYYNLISSGLKIIRS